LTKVCWVRQRAHPRGGENHPPVATGTLFTKEGKGRGKVKNKVKVKIENREHSTLFCKEGGQIVKSSATPRRKELNRGKPAKAFSRAIVN
jgi:hypothetical protein